MNSHHLRLAALLVVTLASTGAAAADETSASAEQGSQGDNEVQTIPVEVAAKDDAGEPDSASTEPAAATSSTRMDDIVVTAQRRSERLQDVPIAVTAFTRDQIEKRRIDRIDDLNSLAPGLQISRTVSNTTISQITIRGSSQINPAIYWDPAVGVYLDGVYIGKSQGSIFDIVDLAGVEVLRGPQGTLYGRNTIGGTINLITEAPTGIFSGKASIELGNYNNRIGKASLNLPQLGIARIKLAARSERRDGWVDMTPTSPVDKMNNRHNDAALFSADLDLWPGIEADYRFDYSHTDQTNAFLQLYRSDDPTISSYASHERQTHGDIDSPSFERVRVTGHSLTLRWDVDDDNVFKAITGYRKLSWSDSLDLDGTPQMVAHTVRLTDYKQLSQDLNFSGHTTAWKYTGGLYYFADDGDTNNPQTFYYSALNFDSRYGTRTHAWAAYGQADWQPVDPLTLTAGYRWTRETKQLDRVLGFTADPAVPYVYYVPEGFTTPKKAFSAGTPLASVAWKFSDDLNVYLRYAEGFKSGGYNGEYSNLQDTPDTGTGTLNDNETQTLIPFKPERQTSIELGAKARFLDGRATANLALFHNKLKDMQISIFTGGGAAASVIRNAGAATVRGAELETAFKLLESTTLRLNYAYLHAAYDEFIDTDANGNVGNQANNRAFVHAPKHSANAVIESQLLNTSYGALQAVVDYAWTDAFYTYPYQLTDNSPTTPPTSQKQVARNSKVPAYGLLNARLAWNGLPLGGARALEIALWGHNLLDADKPTNFIDFGPGLFQNLTVANFVEPRSFGISGILRW